MAQHAAQFLKCVHPISWLYCAISTHCQSLLYCAISTPANLNFIAPYRPLSILTFLRHIDPYQSWLYCAVSTPANPNFIAPYRPLPIHRFKSSGALSPGNSNSKCVVWLPDVSNAELRYKNFILVSERSIGETRTTCKPGIRNSLSIVCPWARYQT